MNNTVNNHETRSGNAQGSLALRSQSSSLKQIRYRKENSERRLKIGPFLVSLLSNFSSLVKQNCTLTEGFSVCFYEFYDAQVLSMSRQASFQ